MINELLLLIEKHTEALIEQTETRPHEILELKMKKQIVTISFDPPIYLAEEGKWLLVFSSFEATNSVFNITTENNSFSISIQGQWNSEDGEEIFNMLNKLLGLRSENDNNLHVK